MDESLNAARIRAGLGEEVLIGRKILVCEQTTSTNDHLWQLARAGAPEGLVLFAEHQIAGRGQRGNVWESAAGKSLLFSVLLRPNLVIGDSHRLTHWAAEMIARTIAEKCQLKPVIKPPNDIYVSGQKVAGVLVEMRAQFRQAHLAIMGIGVNVNQRPQQFPPHLRDRAASLAALCGRGLDRNRLAVDLLRNLDATYQNRPF